jgi:GR25 family glycosyltransferase involved in LPS biosynthesis
LHRIEAVDAAAVARDEVPGKLSDNAKACYLSHLKAIEAARDIDGHVLIVEDDVRFGLGTAQAIEACLGAVPENSWDIIYTDAIIPRADIMCQLFDLRKNQADGKAVLMDMSRVPFGGAMAYIVNRGVKHKLLRMLREDGPYDLAYDLRLRQAIRKKGLRGFLQFPFPTTQSDLGAQSQIQPEEIMAMDAVWTAFRQLTWLEADIGAVTQSLAAIAIQGDAGSQAMGKIVAAVLAPEFKRA